MGAPRTKSRVVQYFVERPNQHVTVKEMRDAISLSSDQITRAIHNLVNVDKVNIETVVKSAVYCYRDTPLQPASSGEKLFVQIGMRRDGKTVVLEDEDGELWKAERI